MNINISEYFDFKLINTLLYENNQIHLDTDSVTQISKSYNYLNQKISQSDQAFYGVNTGFGSLCNTKISNQDLSLLQENLLTSHAFGTGDELPNDIVKLMLVLKAKGLSKGYSGVQVSTVQRLIDFYNLNITPIVYQLGSLGASGDLAPLSHLCLPLINRGEVYYQNKKYSAKHINQELNFTPIKLQAKEGLALINGTQFMTGIGCYVLCKIEKLFDLGLKIAALSFEAFDGIEDAFYPQSHQIRPHKGQVLVAETFLKYIKKEDKIKRNHVQDSYSFRCIPQVHGATYDVIQYTKSVFELEINSVTDNPNIFADEDMIISAGNFHGQPLAMALDYLCIAISELANIAERRIYKLISGERDLPAYLIQNSGLNSGLMIAQYTAASIVSQNKQYCTPASADSIVSSNGQEDHVSMGANAATKVLKVLENYQRILAIELLTAYQATMFKKNIIWNDDIKEFYNRIPLTFINTDSEIESLMQKAELAIETLLKP